MPVKKKIKDEVGVGVGVDAINSETVTLQKPITVNGKKQSEVTINRPTALEMTLFRMTDLLETKTSVCLGMAVACGQFKDGSPLPKDVVEKIDLLDVFPLSASVISFLHQPNLKQNPGNEPIKLHKPISVDGKTHTAVKINRPTALNLMDFSLPDLLYGDIGEVIRLVGVCGHFADGTALPADFIMKIDCLDVVPLGSMIQYFLQGTDLANGTPKTSTSEKLSEKSSPPLDNTHQTSSDSTLES